MPFALISLAVVFFIVLALLIVRRGIKSDALDLGAVSTRWLSELRRDEPWTR